MAIETDFSTEEAATLARLPRRTLANWHEAGFISASVAAKRRGVSKRYSFRDIIALRVVGQLRDAGVSLQRLRKVVEYLRRRDGLSATDVLARTNLVASDDEVYEVAGDVTIQIPGGQRVIGFYVVPLDRVVGDIQRKASALRRAA